MKKINNKGFALAETLVVTVFLMVIFGMIYSGFYPLMGEYEKRETYDDVDGKYAVYWIKRLIEDSSYNINPRTEAEVAYLSGTTTASKIQNLTDRGYVRFECEDIVGNLDKQKTCINLVKTLEVNGCDNNGNGCEIFITKYQLLGDSGYTWFKDSVNSNSYTRKDENCFSNVSSCNSEFISKCQAGVEGIESDPTSYCNTLANKKIFRSGFRDYVESLANFVTPSLNNANYRILVGFHHTKDNNNYYSYATIEVNK